MTRLVLAVLIVAALAVGLVFLSLGLRATLVGPASGRESARPMQQIAFALLVALFLYVAVQGAA